MARTAPEVMLRRHRDFDKSNGMVDARPDLLNLENTLYLTDPRRLPYRGRLYEVPPVGYPLGLRVVRWLRNSRRYSKEGDGLVDDDSLESYADVLKDGARLIRSHVVPERYGRIRRALWRWRLWGGDPFRNATEVEIGEFLGFFEACRTTAGVWSKPATGLQESGRRRKTPPTPSRNLSEPSRDGSERTVSR